VPDDETPCDVLRAFIMKKQKTKFGKWDANKSKWKAGLEKGLDILPGRGDNILYLGASSGTTVGHFCPLHSIIK